MTICLFSPNCPWTLTVNQMNSKPNWLILHLGHVFISVNWIIVARLDSSQFAASRLAFPCLVLPGVCLGLATIVCDRMQMNCSPTKYLVFSSRVMTWGEGRRGVTKQAYQYTLRLNSWPQFAWNIVGWRQRSSYVGDLCSFSYSRSWHCAIIEEINQQTQR